MSITCHQQLFDFMTSTTSHGEKHQNPALVLFWQKWRTYIYNFSFYSRKNMYFVKFLFLFSKLEQRIYLSLSLLESWEYFVWFLFLFSKLRKGNSYFSFSSRNWRNQFHISLSPLEVGEISIRFLFLLSKLEKLISNFSFSSRLDLFASCQPLI